MSIKQFYGKDLLITWDDGQEEFLLWKDYTISKTMEDDEEWIELMHSKFKKFYIQSLNSAYHCNSEQDVKIEFMN